MSTNRLLERLEIPAMKEEKLFDEYNRPLPSNFYHYNITGLIEPVSITNTVSNAGAELFSTAVLTTRDKSFNPDFDINGDRAAILAEYIWWDGKWWVVQTFQNFTEVTHRDYRKAQLVTSGSILSLEVRAVLPPNIAEILAYERAVRKLQLKADYNFIPNLSKLIGE